MKKRRVCLFVVFFCVTLAFSSTAWMQTERRTPVEQVSQSSSARSVSWLVVTPKDTGKVSVSGYKQISPDALKTTEVRLAGNRRGARLPAARVFPDVKVYELSAREVETLTAPSTSRATTRTATTVPCCIFTEVYHAPVPHAGTIWTAGGEISQPITLYMFEFVECSNSCFAGGKIRCVAFHPGGPKHLTSLPSVEWLVGESWHPCNGPNQQCCPIEKPSPGQ